MATVNLGRVGMLPKGQYDPAATYSKLDVVTYRGDAYCALKTLTGVTPTDDGISWRLMVEGGKDADVTKEAIESALGYVPADEADAAFATAGAYTEPVSTEEYSVDIPDGAKYARVDMVGGHVEFIAGQKYIAAVESVVRHSENIFDKSKSIKTRLYPSSSDLSLKPATSGYSVAYKLEPNTTYSISKMPSSRSTFALAKDSFGGLAENAEIIGFRSNITEHTFTTDNNFTWLVWLVWNQNDDGTKLPYETILDSICLAKGDVVKYTPYYAEKHDIPESVRNIDGYGWSAGDAYNSIERTATGWQYVKRVERVMMESLYWRASDGFWMSSSINSITHKPNPDSYAHALWQYGNIVPYNVISGMTSGSWASITSQGTLFVTESENSPVGEFYFELAVPEVIDITAEMGASLSPFALAKGDTITFDNVAEMYVPARVSYAKDITEALDTKADAADLRSTLTPVYTEAKGRYLNLDGRVYTASKYATCDFIAVVPGMTLHLEGFRADAQRAVCAYNRAQELVKVLAVGVPVGYVIDEILPDDAYFIRGCTDYDSATGEVTGTISGYLYGNIADLVVKHDAEIGELNQSVDEKADRSEIPVATKAALTGANHIALTDEEKAVACETLGAVAENGDFELIDDFSPEETVTNLEKKVKSDGTRYSFNEVIIVVYRPTGISHDDYNVITIYDESGVKLRNELGRITDSGASARMGMMEVERRGNFSKLIRYGFSGQNDNPQAALQLGANPLLTGRTYNDRSLAFGFGKIANIIFGKVYAGQRYIIWAR